MAKALPPCAAEGAHLPPPSASVQGLGETRGGGAPASQSPFRRMQYTRMFPRLQKRNFRG